MRVRQFPNLLLLTAFAAQISGSPAARAQETPMQDVAIVVGVDHYANVPRYCWLHGCVHDAQAMQALLEKRHFHVTLLTDDQATRNGILNAIQEQTRNGKIRRFVFYFAGHGTDKRLLLPYDGNAPSNDPSTSENDISRDELYNKVAAVKAVTPTILLDSCFSGAMTRGLGSKGLTGYHIRYYAGDMAPPNEKVARRDGSKELIVKNAGQNAPTGGDAREEKGENGEVCYYAATLGNQEAQEMDFNGEEHGLFTYCLIRSLEKQGSDSGDTWGLVDADVTGQMRLMIQQEKERMRAQQPTLSTKFSDQVVFGGVKGSPSPETRKHSLWDDFNGKRVDERKLLLTGEKDQTAFPANTEFHVEAKVGDIEGGSGYLVVINLEETGDINQVFPVQSHNPEDARVEANTNIRLALEDDRPETQVLRAVLFRDAAGAARLMKAFEATAKTDRTKTFQLKMDALEKNTRGTRELRVHGVEHLDWYTYDLSLIIVK